jgi:hypothetical protein
MTLADLQYLFETTTITELQHNLTDRIIIGYARIQLKLIPVHLFDSAKDWQLMSGIVDQYRRTHSMSFTQRWSLLHTLQRHSSLLVV